MSQREASVQDYEILIHEMLGDKEVSKALFKAQVQLKKQQGDGYSLVYVTTRIAMHSSTRQN